MNKTELVKLYKALKLLGEVKGSAKFSYGNVSNFTHDLLISGGSQVKPSIIYNGNGTYTVGSGIYRMYTNPAKAGIIIAPKNAT